VSSYKISGPFVSVTSVASSRKHSHIYAQADFIDDRKLKKYRNVADSSGMLLIVRLMNIRQIKVKVKVPLYRPWRPLGLREVEAPTFSDIRLTDGGKDFSPMRRPLFRPKELPGTHFC
jgi:hypothetical protein